MFFFIADTHFGHGAIIDLCLRPFKCVNSPERNREKPCGIRKKPRSGLLYHIKAVQK